jgi:hypothetical protein
MAHLNRFKVMCPQSSCSISKNCSLGKLHSETTGELNLRMRKTLSGRQEGEKGILGSEKLKQRQGSSKWWQEAGAEHGFIFLNF